jgi:mono/diheme cytochrome c family protein
MFRRIVDGVQVLTVAAALVTVVLLAVASPTSASVDSPDASAGAEIFSARCSGCHGADGGGGVGPRLAGEGALSRFDALDQVERFVNAGVPGRMPGFETRLSADDVRAVAGYVWSELAAR